MWYQQQLYDHFFFELKAGTSCTIPDLCWQRCSLRQDGRERWRLHLFRRVALHVHEGDHRPRSCPLRKHGKPNHSFFCNLDVKTLNMIILKSYCRAGILAKREKPPPRSEGRSRTQALRPQNTDILLSLLPKCYLLLFVPNKTKYRKFILLLETLFMFCLNCPMWQSKKNKGVPVGVAG